MKNFGFSVYVEYIIFVICLGQRNELIFLLGHNNLHFLKFLQL